MAKQSGDAIPNGENFDVTFTVLVENNGNVTLNELLVQDDIRAQFGASAIDVSNVTVSNFTGTGFAPTANTAFESDTSQPLVFGGLLNVGDTFEVSYTVTIDPDIEGDSDHLVNQATGSGIAIDDEGNQLFDSDGNLLTASDVSDNGADPNAENGEASDDGVFGNDPTPVVIADLGIAKSLVGEPTFVDGVFVTRFAVTVENTGTVDLENLSLVEDLSAQFGDLFVGARDLTLTGSTTNPSSDVTLSSTFDGSGDNELLDQSAINTLHVGDSFSFEFVVELDQGAAGQQLENQILGYGDAIDEQGNPVRNANGALVTAFDESDSGVNPNDDNADDPDDDGTTGDNTIIGIPLFDVPDDEDGLTSGSPPVLLGVPPVVFNSIGNFLGAPGPIYSGIPTNTTNPVSLVSNRPITGGYSGDGSASNVGSIQQVDCCGEIINAVPGQPVYLDTMPMDNMIQEDCGCGEAMPGMMIQEIPMQGPSEIMALPCEQCQAPMDECGCGCGDPMLQQGEVLHAPMPIQQTLRPSFLNRMKGWLAK